MDNKGNNKKNGKGGGPKKNMVGIVSIIVWAIVIVVVINQIASAAAMSGQVEIKFSELIQLVKDDEVEDVKLESNKYTVTLKEDAQKKLDAGVLWRRVQRQPSDAEAVRRPADLHRFPSAAG